MALATTGDREGAWCKPGCIKKNIFVRIQELELTNSLTAGSASPGLLTTRPVTAVKTINSQIAPFLLRAASNWRKKKKELPLSFDEKFSHLPLHCQ